MSRSTKWATFFRDGVAQFKYCEMAEDTPTFGFAQNAVRAQRRLKVEWDTIGNVYDVARQFIGWSEIKTSGGKRYVSRATPHPFPNLFNLEQVPFLYCTSVPSVRGIAPLGSEGGDNDLVQRHSLAEVQVQYNSLPYDVKEDLLVHGSDTWAGIPDEATLLRYVEVLPRQAAKILTLGQGFMKTIEATPKPILWGLPLKVGSAGITIRWHDVPEVPGNAIDGCLSKINSAALVTPIKTFAAETLLLETVEAQPNISALGNRIWTISYHFKYLPNFSRGHFPLSGDVRGHNWILRVFPDSLRGGATSMDYVPVSSDGTEEGTKPYDTADFMTLFRPNQ